MGSDCVVRMINSPLAKIGVISVLMLISARFDFNVMGVTEACS